MFTVPPPELVKLYRSASGDPESRVEAVERVRTHYDFVIVGRSWWTSVCLLWW